MVIGITGDGREDRKIYEKNGWKISKFDDTINLQIQEAQ